MSGVSDRLLSISGVDATIEFGSHARGQNSPGDLDVAVVLADPAVRSEVINLTDSLSEEISVTPVLFTWETLRERAVEMPSFGIHLRDEGQVFGDPEAVRAVRSILDSVILTPEAIAEELRTLQARVERLSDSDRLADTYITAVGRLYAIARAATILRLIKYGEKDYDWRSALPRLAALEPSLASEIDTAMEMRVYFDVLDGRADPSIVLERVGVSDYHRMLEAAKALSAA